MERSSPSRASASSGLRASPALPAGDFAFQALLFAAALCVVGTIQFIAFHTPTEASMGIVQKIFYFHVPAAYSMYVGATACFVGSAGFLYDGRPGWDAFARAGAEVAVAMGIIVLVTGPLWAAKAWGVYWTWDPRLTTSMLSVLLYVAYVVLRLFTGDGDAERRFAAALGVLGAANLPIIHFSVQKWGGNHPKVITSGGGGVAMAKTVRLSRDSSVALQMISDDDLGLGALCLLLFLLVPFAPAAVRAVLRRRGADAAPPAETEPRS